VRAADRHFLKRPMIYRPGSSIILRGVHETDIIHAKPYIFHGGSGGGDGGGKDRRGQAGTGGDRRQRRLGGEGPEGSAAPVVFAKITFDCRRYYPAGIKAKYLFFHSFFNFFVLFFPFSFFFFLLSFFSFRCFITERDRDVKLDKAVRVQARAHALS
jgi:hypothetical protein